MATRDNSNPDMYQAYVSNLQCQVDQLQCQLSRALQEVQKLQKEKEEIKQQAVKEAMCRAMPQAVQYAEKQVQEHMQQQQKMLLKQQQQIRYLLCQIQSFQKGDKGEGEESTGDDQTKLLAKSSAERDMLAKRADQLRMERDKLEAEANRWKREAQDLAKKLAAEKKLTEQLRADLAAALEREKVLKAQIASLLKLTQIMEDTQKRLYNQVRPILLGYYANYKTWTSNVTNIGDKFNTLEECVTTAFNNTKAEITTSKEQLEETKIAWKRLEKLAMEQNNFPDGPALKFTMESVIPDLVDFKSDIDVNYYEQIAVLIEEMANADAPDMTGFNLKIAGGGKKKNKSKSKLGGGLAASKTASKTPSKISTKSAKSSASKRFKKK